MVPLRLVIGGNVGSSTVGFANFTKHGVCKYVVGVIGGNNNKTNAKKK